MYTLWRYHAAAARAGGAANGATTTPPAAFDASPLSEGSLLRADGQRLRGASLTYLDAGELLALVPSTGHVRELRRRRDATSPRRRRRGRQRRVA